MEGEDRAKKPSFFTSVKCSLVLVAIVLGFIAVVCVVTFLDKDVREKVQYDSSDLVWWKKTIIYQIYPRSFQDSNGDGIGDLNGIRQRLDHFKYLNIDTVWISPFYKSPMRDFGYDVANYTEIDPMFGNGTDFDNLLKEAKTKGIRIIMDFVPNHTSNESDWFQRSRNFEEPYRDYYIWDDGKHVNYNTTVPPYNRVPPNNWKSVFGGSAWAWDDLRGQFYYHAFLDSQPDLDFRNDKVREEIKKAMRFWLEKGIGGFRLDALKNMFEVKNKSLNDPDYDNYTIFDDSKPYNLTTNLPEIYGVLKEWKKLLNEVEEKDKLPRLMISESYGMTEDTIQHYYEAGAVPFNFDLITQLNKSCGGNCIKDIVTGAMHNLPKDAWPSFVMGNHDKHRISDRLGTEMVDAMNILLLTLPGTPTTYMGEEIGMEDTDYDYTELQDPYGKKHPDKFKEVGRDPERSPMQWNTSTQAGFTTGKPWLRVNANYPRINVQAQMKGEEKQSSTLKIYKALAELRKQPSFQNRNITTGIVNDNVFSYVRAAYGRPKYLITINFGYASSTDDYSQKPFQMKTGEIVVKTNNFNSNDYSIGKTIDLKSITLKRGQGLVLRLKHK